MIPEGPFSKTIFCKDFFKKQNILQGPKTIKWVQSSCATYANHHKSRVRDYFQKQNILQGPKTKKQKITGTKTKTRHICRD